MKLWSIEYKAQDGTLYVIHFWADYLTAIKIASCYENLVDISEVLAVIQEKNIL